jgi:hypothetical protein
VGLRLVNIDQFYGHLEYFMEIWDILRPFGTFCIHLLHTFFSSVGVMYQEKSGNPGDDALFGGEPPAVPFPRKRDHEKVRGSIL